MTRRELIQAAAAMGATLALPSAHGAKPRAWSEAPEVYAEGVASGDPTSDSVLLWTRVSVASNVSAVPLTVEVSESPKFESLVTSATTRALAAARARWPFVALWDNHEFSWMGWQSQQRFDGQNRPAQTRKVAANQAWFEYQPARISRPGRQSLEQPHRRRRSLALSGRAHGESLESGRAAGAPTARAGVRSGPVVVTRKKGRHMYAWLAAGALSTVLLTEQYNGNDFWGRR